MALEIVRIMAGLSGDPLPKLGGEKDPMLYKKFGVPDKGHELKLFCRYCYAAAFRMRVQTEAEAQEEARVAQIPEPRSSLIAGAASRIFALFGSGVGKKNTNSSSSKEKPGWLDKP